MDWLSVVREHAMQLPATTEHFQWQSLVYKLAGKIIIIADPERETIMFKPQADNHGRYLLDPAMRPAPYLGHKGWLTADLKAINDPEVVGQLVAESYAMILAKLPKSKRPEVR